MITTIENLPLITSALESTDREIRGASKIRWNLRGAVVWAANGLLSAEERGNEVEPAKVRLHTLLCLARRVSEDGFCVTDFDEPNVRLHLNIADDVDVHAEAMRRAKQKALTTRQAGKFLEFHKKEVEMINTQRAERAARVADIIGLCCGYDYTHDTVKGAEGIDQSYDESTIEREIESFNGKLAEVCEQLYWHCDAKANAAFLPAAYTKYVGFKTEALSMLRHLGITEDNLNTRQNILREQVAQQEQAMAISDAALNAEMDAQIAAMNATTASTPEKKAPRRVKAADAHA